MWIAGCTHTIEMVEEADITEQKSARYIFLGHTYDWKNANGNRVDPRIEAIDRLAYDGIWLGGDLCGSTTRFHATLTYLDGLFDLSSNNTHWAVGNHDVKQGNLNWISDFTKRPLYYTKSTDGVTYLVINTTIYTADYGGTCQETESQYQLIQQTLDTIQHSNHLVLLMHHMIWGDCESDMNAERAANSNGNWISLRCEPGFQFSKSVYPRLVEIQERGVQVKVISGDGGQYGKKYHYVAPSGIEFFISGINNSFDMSNENLVKKFNTNPDSILIFEHNLIDQSLRPKFIRVEEL